MTKHIILWTLSDDVADKTAVKVAAKAALEGLAGKIEGLISIRVNIDPLSTSNCDMMLDSEFTSPEALAVYAKHPDHVSAADIYVRPYTASRTCMDYNI